MKMTCKNSKVLEMTVDGPVEPEKVLRGIADRRPDPGATITVPAWVLMDLCHRALPGRLQTLRDAYCLAQSFLDDAVLHGTTSGSGVYIEFNGETGEVSVTHTAGRYEAGKLVSVEERTVRCSNGEEAEALLVELFAACLPTIAQAFVTCFS